MMTSRQVTANAIVSAATKGAVTIAFGIFKDFHEFLIGMLKFHSLVFSGRSLENKPVFYLLFTDMFVLLLLCTITPKGMGLILCL